jgi:hypothetical protein
MFVHPVKFKSFKSDSKASFLVALSVIQVHPVKSNCVRQDSSCNEFKAISVTRCMSVKRTLRVELPASTSWVTKVFNKLLLYLRICML